MAAGVYQIRNTVTGKVYVGSSVDVQSRWDHHRTALRRNDHHSRHLQQEWNEYGESVFLCEVIVEIDKVERLIDLEQQWIDALNAADSNTGYNVCPTAGSMHGYRHTEETIARLSELKLGIPLSEAHKEKIRQKSLGNKSRTGQKQTAEEKQKRGAAIKAFWVGKTRTISDAAREKMRASHTGKKQSQETVAKRRATIQRRKNQEQGVTL